MDESDFLLRLTSDIQEKLYDLRRIDKSSEVDNFCDDLECQVMLAFDSAVKHLTNLRDKLTLEISKYRLELTSNRPPADSGVDRDNSNQQQESVNSNETLRLFTTQINELKEAIQSSMNQENYDNKDDIQRNLRSQAEEMRVQVRELEKKIRREMFKNRFLKFVENNAFSLTNDHLGRLMQYEPEVFEQNPTLDSEFGRLLFSENYRISDRTPLNLSDVNAVTFLTKNELATCSSDARICFWQRKNGLLGEIKTKNAVLSLAKLPCGYLASGHEKGSIHIWDFSYSEEKRFYRSSPEPIVVVNQANSFSWLGHDTGVISLNISSDKLISCSSDGTIRVWNPFVSQSNNDNRLLLSINGLPDTSVKSPLGVLSNDYFVTCTYDPVNGVVSVHNPKDGSLALQMDTDLGLVTNLVVLPNDNIALGSLNSLVQIFSLSERTLLHSLHLCDRDIKYLSIISLPNGHLMTATTINNDLNWDRKYFMFTGCLEKDEHKLPKFRIWDPENGKLLQTEAMTRTNSLHPLVLGKDCRTLAFVADQHSLVLLNMN